MSLAIAAPATAQWTRVTDVPITDIFNVWTSGDTILAGADTAAYISTNAGTSWKRSARLAANVTSVESVRMRNHRIYAGTLGQGVFITDDLGDTWQPYSQGLVGGIANAQLFIVELLIRGDSLYAATSGAGAWVRALSSGTWSPYGNAFEPNQAANMNGIAAGNGRLLACAGFNGTAFFRDPGQPDWTLTWLDNTGAVPGLAALTAIWTGNRWVMGANAGVFTSNLGQSPWTFVDVELGTLFNVSFALRGHDLFANFGQGFSRTTGLSRDDGATWQLLDSEVGVFVYNIAILGNTMYAGRGDGLWRRSIANVGVTPHPVAGLGFTIVGAQPSRDDVRFRFELPSDARARIDVFDLAGRRVSAPVDATLPAGPHEVAWNAGALAPGVYHARLNVGRQAEAVRLVRVR